MKKDINKQFLDMYDTLHMTYEKHYGTLITRDCDNCGIEYRVREADLKRGWGRSCSKSCAAELREENKKPATKEEIFKVL